MAVGEYFHRPLLSIGFITREGKGQEMESRHCFGYNYFGSSFLVLTIHSVGNARFVLTLIERGLPLTETLF